MTDTKISDELRATAAKLRTSSVALSDFIPLLQRAADELDRRVEDKGREAMKAAILEYNGLLRTFHSIASRNGAVTCWDGLADRIHAVLERHHATWLGYYDCPSPPPAAPHCPSCNRTDRKYPGDCVDPWHSNPAASGP